MRVDFAHRYLNLKAMTSEVNQALVESFLIAVVAIAQDPDQPFELPTNHGAVVEMRKALADTGTMGDLCDALLAAAPELSNTLADCINVCTVDTLTFELLWVATNLASGTSAVTTAMAGQRLVALSIGLAGEHENTDVRQQALWFLGNIAGDGVQLRDTCLKATPVVPHYMVNEGGSQVRPATIDEVPATAAAAVKVALNNAAAKSSRETAVWVMSNLVRGKPRVDRSVAIAMCGPFNEILLRGRVDRRITSSMLLDSLWGISYITDAANDRIHEVIETGIMGTVLALLGAQVLRPDARVTQAERDKLARAAEEADEADVQRQKLRHGVAAPMLLRVLPYVPAAKLQEALFLSKDWFYNVMCESEGDYMRAVNPLCEQNELSTPALRACGNVVTSSDDDTDYMLRLGFLNFIVPLLTAKEAVRKEAYWSLSNIAAGTREQIHGIIAAPGLMAETVRHLDTADQAFVKSGVEAAWVVCNLHSGGGEEVDRQLAQMGAVAAVTSFIDRHQHGKVAALLSELVGGGPLHSSVDMSDTEREELTAFSARHRAALEAECNTKKGKQKPSPSVERFNALVAAHPSGTFVHKVLTQFIDGYYVLEARQLLEHNDNLIGELENLECDFYDGEGGAAADSNPPAFGAVPDGPPARVGGGFQF